MKGGNLTHAKQMFLFNTLTTADFGAYLDSVTSLRHLLVKKYGIDIEGGAAGDSALPAGVYAKAGATNAGTKQAMVLNLSPPYPDTDLDYDAWLTIIQKAKFDGFTNQYVEPARNYNYVIPQLAAAVGGNLDPADGSDVDLINEKLINAIVNDPNAIVDAGLGFTFTIVDNANKSEFDVAFPSGTINFEATGGDGAAKVAAMLVEINTTKAGYATAYQTGTLEVTVIESNGGFTFPSNAVEGTLSANTTHYLGLVAKSERQQFYVAYDNEEWADQVVCAAGVYPVLDYEEMCRIFSVKSHQAGSYVTVPIDASYTKYYIRFPFTDHPGITGASSVEERYREVEFYVLTSLVDDNIWDADNFLWESVADDAGFTADTTFDGLLEWVLRLAVASW